MKYLNKTINYLLVSLFVLGFSCSEETLDEINRDLDNPTEVPVGVLLPVIQTNTAYAVVGGDMSLYLAVHTQLVTGVHAQLHAFDRLVYTPQTFQNTWNAAYTQGGLKDTYQMMQIARGTGAWAYVGVGQVLWAYNASVLTDMWGRVPYSEAATGEVFKPSYDMQESIYTGEKGIIAILDSAIVNLQKETTAAPSGDDLIYGGNLDLWVKAAYGLKARYLNRLSNTNLYDPQAVVDAVDNSFADASEAFIFNAFTDGSTTEHPWAQEENDRTHFASSESLFNRMDANNDPRIPIYFDDAAANLGPAPNGTAQLDQAGDLYDKVYDYVAPDSPIEILTYDQLKFYEAEAYLALNNATAANDAYEAGVAAALERYGVADADITTYTGQAEIFPGEAGLTEDHIYEQLYLSFYPFQSQESYVEIRRTGYPALTNPNGDFLKRLPYPQVELDNNADNNPGTPVTNGVWWADGSDD